MIVTDLDSDWKQDLRPRFAKFSFCFEANVWNLSRQETTAWALHPLCAPILRDFHETQAC
jgi:hypothetical protein